jgi:hypothetical protein
VQVSSQLLARSLSAGTHRLFPKLGVDRLCHQPAGPRPPLTHNGHRAAKPAARGLGRRVGHRLLRTAGGRAWFTGAYCLNWRTRYRAIGAEHAAIARLRLQLRAATGALIEELTGIGRHGLRFCNGAVRTGDGRLKKHRISSWVRTDSRPWWLPISVGPHWLWRRHR